MPRRPPPPPPPGTRHPGSGRRKGLPNRITIEAKQLAHELVHNRAYQARLRRDFERRKIHPTIEALLWAYCVGRPLQPVAVAGVTVAADINARLAEERRVFQMLDLADLEQLACESQALMDRAYRLAGIAAGAAPGGNAPQDVVVQPVPAG